MPPQFAGDKLYIDFIEHCGQLLKAGKLDECIMLLDGYLANKLDDPLALYLLGSCYLQLNRYGMAITLLEKAAQSGPKLDWIWHNLGVGYKSVERTDDAQRCYLKAYEIRQDRADTMAMLAGCYVNMGNPKPGIEWARKALALEPDNPHAWNHLSHCLLENGDYKEGWEAYKRRWNVPARQKDRRDYGSVPLWDGQPTGVLAVHGEQGLGDEVLFLTCLPDEGYDQLVIECAKRLVQTMKRSFPNARVYGTHDELMAAEKPDAYLAMGDLAGLFPIQRNPVLIADPEKVAKYRARLEAEGEGPYIAVAWEGGLKQTHRSQRNAPLGMWRDLLKYGTPVSVQYTSRAAAEAKALGIPHWQEAIDDLDEQIALIEACDLVLSVNQTAIHFAGGLGKKTICLTPKAHAWRYLSPNDYMIWYPDTKLLKQKNKGDWVDVFREAEKELADFCRVQSLKSKVA